MTRELTPVAKADAEWIEMFFIKTVLSSNPSDRSGVALDCLAKSLELSFGKLGSNSGKHC